ncbi:MAG: cadmium-translocating P-type ATPase [Anaerolineales bacterium]|nr:cadmium-translocating P-type ATPase [Anaerolineales bacterium]
MENTLKLDVPTLFSDVNHENEYHLTHLENSFKDNIGISRAHVERDKSPINLCLHYDPNVLSQSQVRRIAERTAEQIKSRYRHFSVPIEGMDSSDSSLVIEHSLGKMEGVLKVTADYHADTVSVEFDNHKVSRAAIEKRIRLLGYKIPLGKFQASLKENQGLFISLLAGLFLLIGWLGELFFEFPPFISISLYLSTYLLGGWDVTLHAMQALRQRKFDTDVLMVFAAVGAAFLGEFAEGALLLFLFSLGHALENRALNRARSAISALGSLTPKTALVRRDGKEKEVPVKSLQLEDVVIIRPGVRIPIDGIILSGTSGIDQSSVTGESLPVDKSAGESVFAGTLNGEGALEVSVTRLAKDSTLARVMKMVEEAHEEKSPTQQTMEKFERIFIPNVLLITALIIIVPPLFGYPFRDSFLRAMTLLVAASPCAVALGTPATILAGVAQAARNGVLVKGGAHLENLGRLKAIAFDKTGTLTHGKPEVTDVVAFQASGKKEADVLSIAAGAESRSAHPLAQAVVRAAQTQGVPASVMDEVDSLTGRGLRAIFNGKTVYIGNQKLMEESDVKLSSDAITQASDFQKTGKTLMWVAVDKTPIGLIALADTVREQATSTMKALHAVDVEHTIMLTGDNERAASTISSKVGLTDFRAELMPEDKLKIIRQLVKEHGQVAMVGDGVNDAPALANATVGIAMGGAGTDVALETADVALMGDDLSKLPYAVGLGRATRKIIKQNLTIALGVIAILIITSLTGIVSMGVAVIFHEGSTLVVVANALRLLGYKQNYV